MTTDDTNKVMIQRVRDAFDDQDRTAFAVLCTDDFLLQGGDEGFRGFDAGSENSAAADHCDVACQRRRRHVSR